MFNSDQILPPPFQAPPLLPPPPQHYWNWNLMYNAYYQQPQTCLPKYDDYFILKFQNFMLMLD